MRVEGEPAAVEIGVLVVVGVATTAAAATLPRMDFFGAEPGKKDAGIVGIAIDVDRPKPTVSSLAMVEYW